MSVRVSMLNPYDEACEYLLSVRPSMDARAWFEGGKSTPRSIFEFSPAVTRDILDSIDACGPARIRVIGDEGAEECGRSVDFVLIDLPEDQADRRLLFELEAKVAEETGFTGTEDIGQKYLFLRWT